MITPRKALLAKLKTIMPAVADHDLIPIHTHFIFTGSDIVAYNERIAISVPKPETFALRCQPACSSIYCRRRMRPPPSCGSSATMPS